ncbi:uncharacterized protein SEPMUDRAFT_138188 [Sphaerulina musiva SO2202]|uniref:Uncharacterized protein n=1 Tax=Sphaerulina musiva (strain SO2202) TaxID=692275 RepID=N1QME8_SPHMS|nr:uncharacterized protein SEPMUDRAFT_138188 [Sphaerulina musiva SO2202]EMF17507.1 hypothetical protein SEPMUDRAFT_138188 [Sphaerulina musiva SO2202]
MFLEHGADVHRGDVMFFATGPKRAVEVTRVLLCKGADPNRLRFDGLEPGYRLDLVLALLKGGADVNVKDTLGRTPRMLAELRRESEVLVLLFARKQGLL